MLQQNLGHPFMAITDPYLVSQYSQIHLCKTYGQTCHAHAAAIHACLIDLKPQVVVEYGCGQSELERMLPFTGRWVRYDPAIAGIDRLDERKADLVINTDVLEHVPDNDLDDLLANIASLSDRVFFSICTRPALEILPDGQNAHCTVWPPARWREVLARHFPNVVLAHERRGDSCVFVTWRSGVAELIGQIEEFQDIAARQSRRKHLRHRLGCVIARLTGITDP